MRRGPAGRDRRERRRRGLTLIETLAALSVLALIAAIVWPSFTRSWSRRSFDAAAELLAATLSTARMDAVERGEAVEARLEVRSDGRTLLVVEPLATASGPVEPDGASIPGRAKPDRDEAWRRVVLIRLPRGCRLLDPTDEDDEGVPPGLIAPAPPPVPLGIEPEPTVLPLATFFPDGSCVEAGAIALDDGDGRRARVRIGGVSGRVSLDRVIVRTDPFDQPAAGAPPVGPPTPMPPTPRTEAPE